MARIMGLRRRIYFSSIRALHIARAADGVGEERKESPGILHHVRDMLLSRVLPLRRKSACTEDDDVASRRIRVVSCARQVPLPFSRDEIESRRPFIGTWTTD